jgi:branched-chain amino acid transport system ATP-binding protein
VLRRPVETTIQKGTITREVQPGDLGDASLVGEFIGITT